MLGFLFYIYPEIKRLQKMKLYNKLKVLEKILTCIIILIRRLKK